MIKNMENTEKAKARRNDLDFKNQSICRHMVKNIINIQTMKRVVPCPEKKAAAPDQAQSPKAELNEKKEEETIGSATK